MKIDISSMLKQTNEELTFNIPVKTINEFGVFNNAGHRQITVQGTIHEEVGYKAKMLAQSVDSVTSSYMIYIDKDDFVKDMVNSYIEWNGMKVQVFGVSYSNRKFCQQTVLKGKVVFK